MAQTRHRRIILHMDSSESPVHGEQEGAAYNGHFGCVYYHPLFVFNQFGDCEGAKLLPGNVHSAQEWRELLEPIMTRYEKAGVRRYFRGDAAFAKPELYEYLEEHGCLYAIKLPSNDVLAREIQHLMKRPVGRPPRKPVVKYHDFSYQAVSWDWPRRVVAKVEWHRGELFPRVGFVVTNMSARPKGMVHFYNGRGTTEQWIKGREVRPELDPAVMPQVRGQPGKAVVVCPGLQSGEPLEAAAPPQDYQGLVATQCASEAH